MPNASEILAGLGTIANDQIAVAIVWHALIGAATIAVLLGWRPSAGTAGVILCVLPASVSLFALQYANPFNGIAFGLLTLILLLATIKSTGVRATSGSTAAWWIGAGVTVFGWVYPHFLLSKPIAAYLIASPVGLIPCPTLSVLTGLTLLRRQWFSNLWAITLAAYGVFYALFGALRLGVWLDAGLLIGAVALMATAWRSDYRGSGSNT